MKPWFENWFDSKYYHILYQDRDNNEAVFLIDNILKRFSPKKNASFLDLCCGKGRHAIHLNNIGFNVDGFDLSKKSLEIAKKHENEKLQFHCVDMRTFHISEKYNFVLNLFTSFGYFESEEDNRTVFQNIERALVNNGYLIIDFLNPEYAIRNIKPFEEKKINNISFKIKRSYDQNFIYKEILIEEKTQKSSFTEKVRLINKQKFINYTENLNIKLIDVFGDYRFNDFQPHSSERLLLVFKKTKN